METGLVPMDITTEILSRLPVKSLLRFKCVSKSFDNLISNDPLFRKKHLYHQSNFTKVILFPSDFKNRGGNIVLPCPLLSLSPEGDVRRDMIYLELPAQEGDSVSGQVSFHNTCDGLFCMSMSGGDAVIVNPYTRQMRRIQGCRRLGDPSWIGYSLAHDSRSDVYKLLGLSIYNGCNTAYRLFFYSSTEEMGTWWRYIEDSSCAHAHACDYVKYDGIPTIVNGAFHWLGSNEKDFRKPHVVVSLDISDETYGTLALPQAICCNIHSTSGPILYELKGKLCLLTEHTSDLCCYLWVMNKYGDMDSMTRMIRISCAELPDIIFKPRPFHMLEDDTLIIHSANPRPGRIYFYKDGKILSTTNAYGYWFSMDPYVYFDSLISLPTFLQDKAFNHNIVPARAEHSSNTVPDNAFSVANNFFPITSQDKHVAKKGGKNLVCSGFVFLKVLGE